MNHVIKLARSFTCRYGVPTIRHIDLRVFSYRYYTHCLQCDFCSDWCCNHGVDVDLEHVHAMERHRAPLEAATGVPYAKWFTEEFELDDEVPGGASRRTSTTERGCVFLESNGRGCAIHRYCNDNGIDYHELKSLVDVLFPLTYEGSILTIADEVEDGSLVCLNTGPSIYRGMRQELLYYFGQEFVDEMDSIEASEVRKLSVPASQRQPGVAY